MSEAPPAVLPPTAAQLRLKALQATGGSKSPERVELGGDVFFVFPPTIGQDSDVRAKAMKVTTNKQNQAEVKVNQGLQKAWATVHLVRTADGAQVFGEADVEAILAAPRGSIIDQLATAALKAMEINEEEAGKN